MKTACLIQGDIRDNFNVVLNEMRKHFDVVILSTWKSEKDKIPKGDFIVLLNDVPKVAGYSHRNYQRYSTARGIEKAKKLGCDFILKWRTDMLPTKLNVSDLIKWANFEVPDGVKSRIVTCTFRNLTVKEDWFSTIPDYFAFGHIEAMELLWGDEDIDYNKKMNIPKSMIETYGEEWQNDDNAFGVYCAESELYANFKNRLQIKLSKILSHDIIAKEYMYLIDYDRLGIVWFLSNGNYRSISQAWEHPWWNEDIWIGKEKVIYVNKGYSVHNIWRKLLSFLSPLFVKVNVYKQKKLFERYIKR